MVARGAGQVQAEGKLQEPHHSWTPARRGWSDVTPGIHIAIYEFRDLDHARASTGGEDIKALIAEFDRVWDGRVVRTREVLPIGQLI